MTMPAGTMIYQCPLCEWSAMIAPDEKAGYITPEQQADLEVELRGHLDESHPIQEILTELVQWRDVARTLETAVVQFEATLAAALAMLETSSLVFDLDAALSVADERVLEWADGPEPGEVYATFTYPVDAAESDPNGG